MCAFAWLCFGRVWGLFFLLFRMSHVPANLGVWPFLHTQTWHRASLDQWLAYGTRQHACQLSMAVSKDSNRKHTFHMVHFYFLNRLAQPEQLLCCYANGSLYKVCLMPLRYPLNKVKQLSRTHKIRYDLISQIRYKEMTNLIVITRLLSFAAIYTPPVYVPKERRTQV